jgi:Flp pilus assembly protein TadD
VYPRPWYGNTLWALKRTDDGISQYRQVLRLNPEDAAAHTNLGLALLQKRDIEGAPAGQVYMEPQRYVVNSPFMANPQQVPTGSTL